MLDRVVEQAREEAVFFREGTPTEKRVEAAFLCHAGLSHRRIERVVGRSYEAVRQWYHRLAHRFEPESAVDACSDTISRECVVDSMNPR